MSRMPGRGRGWLLMGLLFLAVFERGGREGAGIAAEMRDASDRLAKLRQRLPQPGIVRRHVIVDLQKMPRRLARRLMHGRERHREPGALQRGDEPRAADLAFDLERDEAAILAGRIGLALADDDRVAGRAAGI